MTRQTGAARPWSQCVAPNAIDISGNYTITNAITTFGTGSLTTTQVGEFIIQNLGTVDVYVGPKASVSVANGIKVPAANAIGTTQMGGLLTLQTGAELGAITSAGTADVRVIRTVFT